MLTNIEFCGTDPPHTQVAYCWSTLVSSWLSRESFSGIGIQHYCILTNYYRDVLYELASVGDLPLPQPSPAPSQKREREEEGSSPPSIAHTPSSTGSYGSPEAMPRSIAGSRRATHAIQAHAHAQASQHSHGYSTHRSMHSPASSASSHGHGHNHNNNFALPIYTEELGRIPIHPGINNSDPLVASGWHTGPQVPSMQGSAFTPHTTTPGGSASMAPTDPNFDPALASMLSMPPSMFDQMMNSFAGPVASSGAIPQPFGTVGGSGLGSLVGGGMAMPAGDGSMSTFTEHEGYMNNWPNPNAPLEYV